MPKPQVGSSDFIFDAADTLAKAGYDFVVLAKRKDRPGTFLVNNVYDLETAEEMADVLTEHFSQAFPDEDDED